MTPKEFALAQIAPYFKDPSICGWNGSTCVNITDDGRMCVAGKNYLPEVRKQFTRTSVTGIWDGFNGDENKIFIPESRGKLSLEQWQNLQKIHDSIAVALDMAHIKERVNKLGLFSYEELREAVNNL